MLLATPEARRRSVVDPKESVTINDPMPEATIMYPEIRLK